MGNTIANKMGENMKKNQEGMIQAQKEIAMKQRQIQMAMQFARGKERFMWQTVFYSFAIPVLLIRAKVTKNIGFAMPTAPIAYAWAYQYDLYYGNKLDRIRKEAERMIEEDPEMFFLPQNNLLMSQEEYNKIMSVKPNQKKEEVQENKQQK